VLHAVVLTQYRRVTDGQTDKQTDGIAVASTALAMRALRRAVKNRPLYPDHAYLGVVVTLRLKTWFPAKIKF